MMDVEKPDFTPSQGADRAEPLPTGEAMHYWPTNGRGFACGTDAGFRTSNKDSVTCPYCKVAKW
jgi:hypothetical protein